MIASNNVNNVCFLPMVRAKMQKKKRYRLWDLETHLIVTQMAEVGHFHWLRLATDGIYGKKQTLSK